MTQQTTETARSLGLKGAANARDLGGYRTGDGRTVRHGVALRADAMNRTTEQDQAVLAASGLRRVVDLRSPDEVREAGADRIIGLAVAELDGSGDAALLAPIPSAQAGGPTLHHVPIFAADFDIYIAMREALADRDADRQRALLGDGKAEQMMIGLYRWFVTSPVARERFATVLRLLAAPDGVPMLFHCSAGKDRTGWVAALALTALGVDRETVFEDYLLTNERSAALIEHIVDSFGTRGLMKEPSLLLPVFLAERTYLETAFAEVEAGWASFEDFWRDGLGLDDDVLDGLRRNLLTD
ncbi:tyrosine-protein phosphatase [Kitasatospora sp. NPDC056138]|uniref:tyrosine-protein phosphatase n=1 Tax=Kitasatospora sp. NPDC056138 TaxID=3345724 RepID=UPI0035DF1166